MQTRVFRVQRGRADGSRTAAILPPNPDDLRQSSPVAAVQDAATSVVAPPTPTGATSVAASVLPPAYAAPEQQAAPVTPMADVPPVQPASPQPDVPSIPGLDAPLEPAQPPASAAPAAPAVSVTPPKAYSLDQSGGLQFDPTNLTAGVLGAYKDGLIDDTKLTDLLPKAQAAQQSVADHAKFLADNDTVASKLKAAGYGLGKGAAFLATAPAGAAAGAEIGSFGGPVGSAIGGAIGGLITGTVGSFAADKIARELAKHNDTLKSFTDAADAHPYYDSAGNLVSFGVGLPKALTTAAGEGLSALAGKVGGEEAGALSKFAGRTLNRAAESYAGGSGSLVDTAQNLSRQAQLQAAGGASGAKIAATIGKQVGKSAATMVGVDTIIKTAMHGLGLSDEGQTLSGAAQAGLIGVFLAGHNIEIPHHSPDVVADVLVRGNQAKASGTPIERVLGPAEREIYNVASTKIDEHFAATGQNPESISVRQATQHGQPLGIAAAEVNPSTAPAQPASGAGIPPSTEQSPELSAPQPSDESPAPPASSSPNASARPDPAPTAPTSEPASSGDKSPSTPTNPPATGQAQPDGAVPAEAPASGQEGSSDAARTPLEAPSKEAEAPSNGVTSPSKATDAVPALVPATLKEAAPAIYEALKADARARRAAGKPLPGSLQGWSKRTSPGSGFLDKLTPKQEADYTRELRRVADTYGLNVTLPGEGVEPAAPAPAEPRITAPDTMPEPPTRADRPPGSGETPLPPPATDTSSGETVSGPSEESSTPPAESDPPPLTDNERRNRIAVPRQPQDSDRAAAAREWVADEHAAGRDPEVIDVARRHRIPPDTAHAILADQERAEADADADGVAHSPVPGIVPPERRFQPGDKIRMGKREYAVTADDGGRAVQTVDPKGKPLRISRDFAQRGRVGADVKLPTEPVPFSLEPGSIVAHDNRPAVVRARGGGPNVAIEYVDPATGKNAGRALVHSDTLNAYDPAILTAETNAKAAKESAVATPVEKPKPPVAGETANERTPSKPDDQLKEKAENFNSVTGERRAVTPEGQRAERDIERLTKLKAEKNGFLSPADTQTLANAREALDRDLNRQALGTNPQPTSEAGKAALARIRERVAKEGAGVKLDSGEHAAWKNDRQALEDDFTAQRKAIDARRADEKNGQVTPPGQSADKPITPETARKTVQDLVGQTKKMLRRNGINGVEYDGTSDANGSGLEFQNGTMRVDPKKLATQLTRIRELQRERGIDGTPHDWLAHAVVEEQIHGIQEKVAAKQGMTLAEFYGHKNLPDSAMPADWETAGRKTYSGWDDLPRWAQKAEFTRMVVQGRYNGQITEGLFRRTVEKVINYLKGTYSGPDADARFSKVVDEISQRFEQSQVEPSRGGRLFKMPFAPTGVPDVLDHVAENGGIVSPNDARQKPTFSKYQGDYDSAPDLKSFYHHAVYGGEHMPDQMASILHENHGVGDGSVEGMWKAIGDAKESRTRIREQQKTRAMVEKQSNRFEKDALAADTAKGKTKVYVDSLAPGDKVQIGDQTLTVKGVDPHTLDVELDDHSKYGVQKVANGEAIYVEKVEPKDGSAPLSASAADGDERPVDAGASVPDEKQGGDRPAEDRGAAGANPTSADKVSSEVPRGSGAPDSGARPAGEESGTTPVSDVAAAHAANEEALFGKGGPTGHVPEGADDSPTAPPTRLERVKARQAARRELSNLRDQISASFDAAGNQAGYHAGQAKSTIGYDLPDALDDQAARAAVEAGYDPARLREDLARVQAGPNKKLVRQYAPIYQHALDNLPRLRDAAEGFRQIRLREDAAAEAAGLKPSWQRRVDHLYNDPLSPESTLPIDQGLGIQGGEFKTAADAIAAGVDPRSMRLSDATESLVRANRRAINQRAFQEGLRDLKASDGKPIIGGIVETSERLDAKGERVAEQRVPQGYETVQAGGNLLTVHKEFAPLLKSLYGESAFDRGGALGVVKDLAALAKHGTAVFDTYHGFKVLYKEVLGFQTVGYDRGLAALELSDADLGRAVAAGDYTQKEADWVRENRPTLERGLRAGLNVDGMSDNLLEAARQHNLVEKIPVLGPALTKVNDLIFRKLSRGAMVQAYVVGEARNRARFPELSEEEVARRSAQEANEFFGNLGHQGFLKDPTMRDAANVLFFAPSWAESTLRSEARGIGQAAKGVTDAVRGKGLRLGVVAQALGGTVLASLVANQALNLFTRGKTTFQNEEEGHRWDAWIPGGPQNRGFWLSPLSIAAEYSHSLSKYLEGGESPLDAVAHVAANKLSGPARAAKDLVTGKDYAGRSFGSTGERLTAAATDLLPSPMPLGSFVHKDPSAPLGYTLNHEPGALQKQAFASLGLKLDNAQSARSQMHDIAARFKPAGGPQAPQAPSVYANLRHALSNGDEEAARGQINDLVTKGGRTISQVAKAGGLDKNGQVAREVYTGSPQAEARMLAALTPDERKVYERAQAEHAETARLFGRVLGTMLKDPATRQALQIASLGNAKKRVSGRAGAV